MKAPSIAIRECIRQRLLAAPNVLSVVPADQITNDAARPEFDRQIVIGGAHTRHADDYDSFHEQVFLDIHVYAREHHTTQSETIAYAVRQALRARPWQANSWTVHGLSVSDVRLFRDPGGAHSHAILHIDATVQEAAQ